MAEFTVENISICSKFQIESEDDFLRLIDSASNLNTPNSLKNLFRDYDEKEPFESEVRWGPNGVGELTEHGGDGMVLNVLDEANQGHVHINLSKENRDVFMDLFSKVLTTVGDVEVDPMIYNIQVEKSYEELKFDVNIELTDDVSGNIFENTGVRFDLDDPNSDFLFQKNPIEDNTIVRYGVGPITTDSDSTETLIEDGLRKARTLIEAL